MYNTRVSPIIQTTVVYRLDQHSNLLNKTSFLGDKSIVTWNGKPVRWTADNQAGYILAVSDKSKRPEWVMAENQPVWAIGKEVLKAEFEVLTPPRGSAAAFYTLRKRT